MQEVEVEVVEELSLLEVVEVEVGPGLVEEVEGRESLLVDKKEVRLLFSEEL